MLNGCLNDGKSSRIRFLINLCMTVLSNNVLTKAAKDHSCGFCGYRIPKGGQVFKGYNRRR